jgi:hypothetical protein
MIDEHFSSGLSATLCCSNNQHVILWLLLSKDSQDMSDG